jgi:hypothetical protein
MPVSVEGTELQGRFLNQRRKEASRGHLQSATRSSSVPRFFRSSHDAFESDPNDMIVSSSDPRHERATV